MDLVFGFLLGYFVVAPLIMYFVVAPLIIRAAFGEWPWPYNKIGRSNGQR